MTIKSARAVTLAGLLVALVLALLPSQAQAFSKAIWGDAFANGVNQFPIYRRLGVSIIEQSLNWSEVAPTRPADPTDPNDAAYQWPAELQQTVDLANAYHMRVLVQVIFTPSWANGGRPESWVPLKPADFAAFVTAAARRYPSVHLWMVWGEPDRSPNFRPFYSAAWWVKRLNAREKIAPHNYARLLDAAYGALKAVSRSNLVIGGSTYSTGNIDPEQWVESLLLPNGRPPRMDMYAHNPFTLSNPSLWNAPSPWDAVEFPDLPRFERLLVRHFHRRVPIFISEYTLPTQRDQEFNYGIKPRVAANWLSEALRIARRWPWLYAFGWVHVYDEPPVSYGGLLSASGTPKPDFWAFARG